MTNTPSLVEMIRTLRAALCAAGLLAATGVAHAAELKISAEFRPSALDPTRNTFANTTPPGAYCQWKPEECKRLNAYVVDLPINIMSKTYVKGPDIRKRFYVALPGPRRVTATNDGGASIDVDVAIRSISGELSPGGDTNPVFQRYPEGGCSYVYTAGVAQWVRFGWNVRSSQSPAPCHSVGQAGGAGFTRVYSSRNIGLGLTVTTPSPLGMQNGVYRGQLEYSVGGLGSDIDFGDDVQMTDEHLVVNFEFTVEHDFKVERPPGTEVIALQPANGWNDWVERGRPPVSLRQELPFLMTTSGDFSVRLECEVPAGDRCAIRSESGEEAALDVAMTIPGLYDKAAGAPVAGYPLKAGGVPPGFRAREYMQNRPSRLMFSVTGDPLRRMLDMPGSRWRGDVTVIFDATP